ncbi:MaoC family dehydratase [Telluria mixta]|jgi:acyl dehydratase|uniref:MaoC family dehydratase n=1 Tax=Telluria mixta TaxID=34071 RepID=A0ABT2C3R7_9BURK|nr:MaoC family dehydratase [Telluria mixta]MCS0632028.1 MaoC family dehydratase [Telluria mixta]WEM95295.1 MaoC family dehydratase [Telluria mixta]
MASALHEVTGLETLRALVGTELGRSRWFEIGQDRIATFADATDDHQWIHIDPERAARESPFGGTVAHGFLTLSLLPSMLSDVLAMVDAKLVVNYGLNKVRFPAPVPAGSRVRAAIVLAALDDEAGSTQLTLDVTVEREGGTKPVCVAEFLVRRYA